MYRVNGKWMDIFSLIKLASILAGVEMLGISPALVWLMSKGYDIKEGERARW